MSICSEPSASQTGPYRVNQGCPTAACEVVLSGPRRNKFVSSVQIFSIFLQAQVYFPSKHTKIIPVVSVMCLPPKNIYNKHFENMSIFQVWFTSIQAGNTACNCGTHCHLVLSHKAYQNQGICYFTIVYCYVTKAFVARNKFPHVKVARNTTKVGQAWRKSITFAYVQLRGNKSKVGLEQGFPNFLCPCTPSAFRQMSMSP